jgi:hypothetical protein
MIITSFGGGGKGKSEKRSHGKFMTQNLCTPQNECKREESEGFAGRKKEKKIK